MKKIIILLTMLALFSWSQDARAIAAKHFKLAEPDTMSADATMLLINKNGRKKVRKLKLYARNREDGSDTYTEFLEPADVKGTKFLTLGHNDGDDEQRLYLPALSKVRRISASGNSGSFMGSDLSYYDMQTRGLSDFTYSYLRKEEYRGKNCHVLELTPVDDDSPYAKVHSWIAADNFFTYKMEMYDKRSKKLLKRIVNIEVNTIKGFIIATKIIAHNLVEDTKTLFSQNDIKVNENINSSVFSVQNLMK